MKASEKIKGIVFAYNTSGEYEMVKELGVEWMRLNICFPWADKMFGTLSEEYIQARQEILDTHAKGFQVMPATPLLAGFPMMKRREDRLAEHFPEFVGKKGTDEFYENVRESQRFICEDLGEAAGIYWQCMNEIDIPVFSNDYPDDILADTARAARREYEEPTLRPDAASIFPATMKTR